jgi:trigger factor
MELSVRDVSGTVAELSIKLEADKVQQKLDKRYAELAKEIHLPGFRKGKVPRTVLRKRFGRELERELAGELAGELLEKALQETKLIAVGEPEVETLSIAEGEAFRLVVRVEHLPEIRLQRYKGLAPPPEDLEVGEEELARQMRNLQLRNAERHEADRPAQEGDHVEGRYRLYVNDELDGESEEVDRRFEAVIGEDHLFAGTRLDRQLAGHAKGERFRVEAETPLAFPAERLRGRRLALDIELDKIEELELRELDDAFTQEKFQKSVEELRDAVRRELLEAATREDRDKRLQVVFERLRDENPFPLPESMLHKEMQREQEQWDKQHVPAADRAELLRTQPERVERRLRNALLLQKVIEQEQIEATDADFRRRYERMAPIFGRGSEEVERFYRSQERLHQSLRDEILEGKAVELLLESTSSLIVEV